MRRIALAASVVATLAGCSREPAGTPAASATPPPVAHTADASRTRYMPALLRRIAAEARETSLFTGERSAHILRDELSRRRATMSARDRLRACRWLAFHELRLGNIDAAVALLEEANALLPELAGKIDSTEANAARFDLAIAYLRLGESRNCVALHTSQSCILPIGPGGVHQDQDGSRRAMAHLTEVLAHDPQHLSARWLVNVAAMTVGDYPHAVPAEQLIPPERFTTGAPFPRFTDVASELGLDARNLAGGVVIDDFDGDDVAEVIVSSSDPSVPLRYLVRGADGRYRDRATEAGLADTLGGASLVQADHDGDGDLDLLVLRGAWLQRTGRHPKSLLANDGHGRFTDVTFEAGLGEVHYPSQAAAWADYDGDGDLDLYVGNEWSDNFAAPSQLFRNRGDGTFQDVAEQAGVRNERMAKAIAWADFDSDGHPDLFVSNLNGANRLYRNQGDGTFTDVAEQAGVAGPWASFPVAVADFDEDGALDLFVGGYTAAHEPWTPRDDQRRSFDAVVASFLDLPSDAERPRLLLGDGRGAFRDASAAWGLDRVVLAAAASVGDVDGDGFLDLHLATAYPGYEALMPNVLLRNDGGTRFADVTAAGGFGHLQKAHAAAFADLDHDGDQDLFLHTGGMFAGDAFGNAVLANPGNANRSVRVRLVGTTSNRSAIGARLSAEIVADGRRRTLHRTVASASSSGAGPLAQTIGIGSAAKIDTLTVHWPTTGRTQVVQEVPAGAAIVLTEPGSASAPPREMHQSR